MSKSPEDVVETDDGRGASVLFPIVGIGASAGGLEAFTQLLRALPLDTGLGFVLVQHLDPEHESALTQILSRATKLPVHEVKNNEPVLANHVHVIPPDMTLSIAQGVLKLNPRPHTRTPHRPIDSFFESLAADRGDRAIGVVLSGTASDGTLGLEAIKAEAGITFAQDDSAKYDSMPRSAIAAGCVDLVLAPADIAKELARIAKHPYVAGQPLGLSTRAERDRAEATAHEDDPTPLPSGGSGTPPTQARKARAEAKREGGEVLESKAARSAEDGYRQILLLLRNHSGVDFALYKSSTIQRRITRRLVLSKLNTIADYARFLRGNSKELDALYSDVLISVTSFFRNPEMFDALQREVLPKLLKQSSDDPIRAWILGCSTGQEAYSVAMAFVEGAEKAPHLRRLQVFATDLNDNLLDKARHGLYARTLAEDLAPERLRRFFIEEEGGYRVNKMLRDMVVFARQNLISDPPFSRMDLISCRNLLIYLEPSVQKKAIPTFHYALKPGGFLLLGTSESVGGFTDLFEPVDKKYRIYSKKPAPTPAMHLPLTREHGAQLPPTPRLPLPIRRPGDPDPLASLRGEVNAQREADRITLHRFAPAGVLVNAELQVLQFRGPTAAYLQPPAGKASFDVLKMAREGMMLPLRAAINEAKKANKTVRRENVRVGQDGRTRRVNIEVIPLTNVPERSFLILFEKAEKSGGVSRVQQPVERVRVPALRKGEESSRIAELEADLSETRDYLQSMQEQHESANEELQAAGEEVQSSNEELQSVNEELETSKEELESANEELTTVNDEMANRNAELDRVNNDLVNLLTSVQMPIVILGPDLRVRRFTPAAEKLLNLVGADVGRPIGAIRLDFDLPDLEPLLAEVLDTVSMRERDVRAANGRWYSLRLRPYRTLDNRIDGVVMMLVDVHALRHALEYTTSIVKTVREPLLVLDGDLRVRMASDSFYQEYGVSPKETENRLLYELGNGQWNIPALRRLLEEILPQNSRVSDYHVEHEFEHIGRKTMSLYAHRFQPPGEAAPSILLTLEDITERKQAEEELREGEQRYRTLASVLTDLPWRTDADGAFVAEQPAWMQYTGQTWEQARGFGWANALHADDRARILEIWEHAREARSLYESRGQLWHAPTQQHRYFIARATPILDADGSVREWVGACTDIDQRARAEEALHASEERFRTLADNMSQFAWTADAKGWIYWYNKRWYDYTGTTLEEMQGWGWRNVHHPDHVDRVVKRIQRSWDTGEIWEDTFPLRGRDGNYRWFLSRALPIRDENGDVVRWFGTNTDVTEQRDADRRKNEFLALLAHELRNPLAPIRNALQIMRQKGDNADADASAYEMMERQVGHMVRLVDELLDVSRISRGRIELHKRPIELASMIHQAVEAARPLCDGIGQELAITLPSKPLYANADPTRLVQVFGNLLSNACKFTGAGGQVSLTMERDPEEQGQAVIRVRDTGIGIGAEQLPRVFDMFMQVDTSLERSVSGLGIGLTLAKNLVELHDGTIEVDSPGLGQGSEFVVRLPIMAKKPDAWDERTADEPVVMTGYRILVVDDNRDAAESLAALLTLSGNEISVAYDGVAAVAAAATFRPEIVLLDIGLPKLNGFEVARKIRREPWGKNVVLVALTGWGQDEDRRKSTAAGFDGHLVKPVDHAALIKILGDFLPVESS